MCVVALSEQRLCFLLFVQEIRFVINPECLVSCLVCEVMADNEAIAIIGAERFSNYKGYGGAFAFAGPHVDKTEKDDQGRIATGV